MNESINRYLREQYTLTLCTFAHDDPWAAPCFYAFDEFEPALLILTDESTTQHGRQMQVHHQVAGSIFVPTQDISQLQGIQFLAQATKLEGDDAIRARSIYNQRFPFAARLISPIWQLRLDQIKYINHQLGFGHKESWQRDAA